MAVDPFFGTSPVLQAMENRRGYIEQLRENTSRQAQSFNFVQTTGIGEIRLPTALTFICTFVERPAVAYGWTVESDLPDGPLPTSTGGVYGWVVDARGFYLGCYVYVVVGGAGRPVIQHDFTFSGTATKDLPEHLLDL